VANANVMVGGGVQPLTGRSDGNGSFKVDGLAPGRSVTLFTSVGMPMMDQASYLPDARSITVPEGKDTVDIMPIKMVKGDMLSQEPGDVGIWPRNQDGRALVDHVMDKSPAAQAGIKPGDSIQSIDGKDCSDLGGFAVGAWLRGPVGSQVTIVINGRSITLTRAQKPPGTM
jgi:membrane-associated protease RseP (regulator of RpoE activity)